MERTGRNEQNVFCFNRTVFRGYRSTFNDRQNVALNAFAGNVGTGHFIITSNFIELVNEHDAFLFCQFNGSSLYGIHIKELLAFFLNKNFTRFTNCGVAFFLFLRHERTKCFRNVAHVLTIA